MDFDKINIDAVSYNVKDTTARQQISDETTAREQADSQLSQQISAEISARTAADSALGQQISAETTAREQADSQLSQQIAALAAEKNLKTVFDYGAKGDGVTDDTNAFTESLADQGVCIVPKGVFAVTTINVTGGQSIIGVGPGNSILKAIGSGNVIYGSEVDGAVFAHFAIDGANKCYNGLHVTNSPTGLIDDCFANNCQNDGFHLDGVTYTTSPLWRVNNCFASVNGACGFYIAISDTTVIGCTAVSNGQVNNDAAGIEVQDVAAKITNCHCWCRSDDAGYIRPSYSMRLDGPDIDVVNCHIEGAKVACLIIGQKASNVDIIASLLYAPFGDYIVWTGQWNPNFTNCRFSQDNDELLKSFFGGTAENYKIVSCSFNGNVPLNDAGTMNNSYFLCTCSANYETAFKNVNTSGCRGVAMTAGGVWNDFPKP